MLGVFLFHLCLLLPSVVRSEFPDFGDDYDWYDNRYICEGDACVYRSMYLSWDKTFQVPNKTVTFEEYEYFDVDLAGLLADCAPSLSIGDIASEMKSCEVVKWKYQDACKYRKKGWLDPDGKTVNESLATDFKEIEGVSENIMKCLEWDGVNDYDYYYDYMEGSDDYYYNYMEESDDIQVRAKREQKSSVPEFMIQKTRLKRSSDNKATYQKEENKHVKKRRNRKGKNKGKNGRKSEKNGKKMGKKGQARRKKIFGKQGGKYRRRSGRKNGKGRQNSKKRKHKAAKKSKKKKSQYRKKKGNNKANEKKKKREERKKKKKERKLLKALGYDSMPSEETLNKLYCVEMAFRYGLTKCGEKIFENVERP